MHTQLADGTILLRPLTSDDVNDHLRGEDDELIRWLNGGPGSVESVRAHVEESVTMWAAGGPVFTFGIRVAGTDVLTGTIDVQTQQPYVAEDQANLAFGLYPEWRGLGYGTRAVLLALEFLRGQAGIRQAVIRVSAANPRSADVARRAGFRSIGPAEFDGLQWFIRDVG